MLKQVFAVIVYLIDHWSGQVFYRFACLANKITRLKLVILSRINKPGLLEIRHLREEGQRLRYANALMRQELNRVKSKKLCLCKKLQIIYFKLRFGISLRKISRYLPVSRSSVINYLNQLQSGISNLVSRIRGYPNSPNRTPISIAGLIWQIHQDNPHWGRWKTALAIWKLGVYVSPSTVRNILNTPKPDCSCSFLKQRWTDW